MSLAQPLPREMHLCRSSSNIPRPLSFLQLLQNRHVCATQNCILSCGLWHILSSTCASHQNGAHFLNIASSKSAPNVVCFIHFDLEICFPPQRHALFEHLNFQSAQKVMCFRYFHLEMCFAPQWRALVHHLSQRPKMLRDLECFAPQRRVIFNLSSDNTAPHPPL